MFSLCLAGEIHLMRKKIAQFQFKKIENKNEFLLNLKKEKTEDGEKINFIHFFWFE